MIDGELINTLEQVISDEKHAIEMFNSLERLRRHPDFIKIIQKGYLQERAIQLVAYRGHSDCMGADIARTDQDIVAIGRLSEYFSNIATAADSAIKTIEAAREQISQLEQSEGEE